MGDRWITYPGGYSVSRAALAIPHHLEVQLELPLLWGWDLEGIAHSPVVLWRMYLQLHPWQMITTIDIILFLTILLQDFNIKNPLGTLQSLERMNPQEIKTVPI
jgi:hypothetical protein